MYNSPISNTHPIFENTEFPNIMDKKKYIMVIQEGI
jgi:hypothetical protein